MSNRTDVLTKNVHGTNPQFLIGQIVRKKIYEQRYWKEHCFALSGDTLVDKAVGLQYIGGVYGGNQKPTPFLCLLCKLLQIGPANEVIDEYIAQTDFKYLQCLGAVYLRLTGTPQRIYESLEGLLHDNRKLRYRTNFGTYRIIHMDEFADELLTSRVCLDIDLPNLPSRWQLEASPLVNLDPRSSICAELYDEMKEQSPEKLAAIFLPKPKMSNAIWTA